MSMNPRVTTDKIREDYQEYISSILSVKDKEITRKAHRIIKESQFVKGPYLEATLPFKQGHSLQELAQIGLISNEFSKMGDAVHFTDWKLRIHQEEAIKHIIEKKRNMVVSTGTGSGKTECYLYPIINELMREKEKGCLNPGVRALLIFPMNALANDQQKKLRKLLKEYPDITFGRYTGETLHKGRGETPVQAEDRMHKELVPATIKNELLCREYMAENPPHILLTNYAMLEYMLLRPDTAPFFDTENAKNWRFIVIDEAHSYKGAQGTEIAYLLRRVKERIKHHMKGEFTCIATSATLGNEDAKGDLANFAEVLFDEPFDETDVITTQREKRVKIDSGRSFKPQEYIELKQYVSGLPEDEKEKYLYSKLIKDNRLFSLYDILQNKPKRIEEVAQHVFPDIENTFEQESALIDLIELSAAARKSEMDSALFPARYHLFVKSLEGMFVQYYPEKNVFLDRKESITVRNIEYPVFELANCQKCEQEYLIGKTIYRNGGNYFVQTSTSEKPEYYFIDSGDGEEFYNQYDEDDEVEENEKTKGLEKYRLCLACGKITDYNVKPNYNCCPCTDNKKIVLVYKLNYSGKDNESNCCPCCGSTQKGLLKRFLTANQPATFAIAKSLYDAIPPRFESIKKDIEEKNQDIFDFFEDDYDDSDITVDEAVLNESGRKLLVFSDNRQEAAFFAGFFQKKYMQIMWRKVILRCLYKAPNKKLCIEDLISRALNEAEKCGLYEFDFENNRDYTDDQKRVVAAHYIMQEFLIPDQATSLEGLGYIKFSPDSFPNLKGDLSIAGVSGNEIWNVMRYLMNTLRQKFAVTYPEEIRATDDFFAPRNHYGYFRKSESRSDRDGYIYGYIPQDGKYNKRLAFISKLEKTSGLSENKIYEESVKDLGTTYDLLIKLLPKKYIVESSNSSSGIKYCLNHAKWNVSYIDDEDLLYKCNKCGKVYSFSVKNVCPEMKCTGNLEPIKAKEIRKVPYYENIYKDEKIIPMVAKEHTAQLERKTAGDYQKNFESGKINVLSCSTTFEMGVDVGELEATFQRNVPPETSNYIQRAGRAGRRTSSAAFSVTFSRRNSHDMTFFQDPSQIIAGKIPAPILTINNDRIAVRHLYSIVISWFFKIHPEFFKNKTREIVSFDNESDMSIVLKEELENKPQELLNSIHNVFSDEICNQLGVDDWSFTDDLLGEDGILKTAISERLSDIKGLKEYIKEINKDAEVSGKKVGGRTYYAENLISTLTDQPSIDFLSSNGVIPKYGFPIDSVSLNVISGDKEEASKIDLTRDLKMAISEYAPPAQIVANGKLWQSYAINTVPDKSWPTYIYYECKCCNRIYPPESLVVDVTFDIKSSIKICKECGSKMYAKKFIVPLFGFSTKMGEKPKIVGDSRPKSYYNTQTQFWGIEDISEKEREKQLNQDIELKGKYIKMVYSPGGKLFVLNQGVGGRGISVCPICGYAADPINAINKKSHKSKIDRECKGKLISVSLGHDFSTDILKIELPRYHFKLNSSIATNEKSQELSVLYAIIEGASKALSINRNDISGCISSEGDIILYDDTPGGSGYVKQIYLRFKDVLISAKDKVSGICGCSEETSCYGCLREYSNQYCHDRLSRGLAYEYLDWLLNANLIAYAENSTDDQIKNNQISEKQNLKHYDYNLKEDDSLIDNYTIISQLISDYEDDKDISDFYNQLLKLLSDINFEKPIVDTPLKIEKDVWPAIFWPKSKVALFYETERADYDKLKKYDWHCFVVSKETNPEEIIKYLLKDKKKSKWNY